MSDTLAKDVRRAAMNLLARREHGFAELVRKLALRFPEELVAEQVTRLKGEKLQSDNRFTESYVYSRQQRGYGPVRIRFELSQKGIGSDLINEFLFDDDETWNQTAIDIKSRKFGEVPPIDYKQRARQIRFLMQRGFSSYQANQSFVKADFR